MTSAQNSNSVTLDKKKKGPTPEEIVPGNLRQNKARKQDFKRMKKERKRSGVYYIFKTINE